MKQSPEKKNESKVERFSRLARNWNIIGALALAGAAIALPAGSAIETLAKAGAFINVLQVGFFEIVRQGVKSARLSKSKLASAKAT